MNAREREKFHLVLEGSQNTGVGCSWYMKVTVIFC